MSAQNDLVELDVNWNLAGAGLAQNTFGFKCINVGGATLASLATAFKTALVHGTAGGFLFQTSSSLSTSSITVKDIKPGTAVSYEYVYTPVAGQVTGDMLPPQCAFVYSLKTALKGRSYRGRFYLPGIPEVLNVGGQCAAASLANMVAVGTQLYTVFGPGGTNTDWQLVVISRWLNHAKRVTPVGTPVESIEFDPTIRTQRRRVLGVGS